MRKARQRIISILKKILKICKNKPISFEVFADENQSMIQQGKLINSWGKMFLLDSVINSKNKFMVK